MTTLYRLHAGTAPLLVTVPHAGTVLPDAIARRLTPAGLALLDTDWHVDRLADFAPALGASLLVATHSRTVIDLNRAPGGGLLYPGQVETALCPTESFAGDPLYAGAPPDAAEVADRVAIYWQPFHAALRGELDRLQALHGRVCLLDLHSIASRVPRLFEGVLPDFNIGSNGGASAAPRLIGAVMDAVAASGFTQVLDGRFRGGAITRGYGRPQQGVHAIQIEIGQDAYLDGPAPPAFDPVRGGRVADVLRSAAIALLQG